MRILKPFMLLAVIGVLYSCAAVHLQTYRNGYIMDKNNVVVGISVPLKWDELNN